METPNEDRIGDRLDKIAEILKILEAQWELSYEWRTNPQGASKRDAPRPLRKMTFIDHIIRCLREQHDLIVVLEDKLNRLEQADR